MAYKNILPFDEQGLVDWIAEVYGLAVEGVDLHVGYRSTVAILFTGTLRFVLKCVHKKDDTQQALAWQITLVKSLHTHQMPVADCVMGKDQQYFYENDGQILSLWTFLIGDGFELGNQQQLEGAGETLGNMHRIFATEAEATCCLSLGWAERVEQLTQAWQALAKAGGQANKLVICLDTHLEKWAVPIEKESRIVIHNDFRAQNLLFRGTEVSGILDFDDVCVSPRIWDLAYALSFFQAVVADRPLSVKEMGALIKGYHRHHPIDGDDLSCLPQWLGLALLKGLTLWGQICYCDQLNPNVQMWIDGYLPLLEKVDDLGLMLQDDLVG